MQIIILLSRIVAVMEKIEKIRRVNRRHERKVLNARKRIINQCYFKRLGVEQLEGVGRLNEEIRIARGRG